MIAKFKKNSNTGHQRELEVCSQNPLHKNEVFHEGFIQ